MGLMDKIRRKLFKSKPETSEKLEGDTTIHATQTRYGKKLNLSPGEKIKLVESLTPREKETFFILLGGYSLKEAAGQLNVGYSTANTYQTAIYKNSKSTHVLN